MKKKLKELYEKTINDAMESWDKSDLNGRERFEETVRKAVTDWVKILGEKENE